MIFAVSNWAPIPLQKALYNHGITLIKLNFDLRDIERLKDFDIIYYAKPVPPMISKDLLISKSMLGNVRIIYGLHMPLTIDNKVRLSHYIYDAAMIAQSIIAKLKNYIIHTLNMTDYKIAKSIGLKPIYLPLGTDTSVFQCKMNKPGTFTLIYASRPSWHKGTDLLVNLIIPEIIKKLGNNVRIIITDANYDYMQWIYNKIRNIRNVELYPHVSFNELAKLFSEAHVLLFPSRYESFGLAVLDAMASGIVPVAFNVRGFVQDVLLHNKALSKYIVEYPNVQLFISRVLELYELWYKHIDEFNKLVHEVCKIASNYSWNNISVLWAKTLKSIIEGKAA